jgi:hypothetical protein
MEEVSFQLQTRRLEYIFEYYRQIATKRVEGENKHKFVSIREVADEQFVNELRFNMVRILSIS